MATDNSPIHSTPFETVRERIRRAAAAAGRTPDSIALLAASKGREARAVEKLARQGQRRFGESYLQEALNKRNQITFSGLEWHFIGPIQANKTRGIARSFDWVLSVDRLKILRRLDEQRPGDLPPMNICLQVNVSGEASKSGVSAAELPALAEAAANCRRLHWRGVMTIPAPTANFQQQRAACARLRALFEELQARGHELDTLSMGMSGDLEAAIAEGATLVRVGRALFEG